MAYMPYEARTREAPRHRNVHTIAECDLMLALPLDPAAADAWLDERLSAMRALAFNRPVLGDGSKSPWPRWPKRPPVDDYDAIYGD